MEGAPGFSVGGGLPRGGLVAEITVTAEVGVTCRVPGAGAIGCGAETGVLLPTPAA